MKKYRVTIVFTGSTTFEVEAEDEEGAELAAIEQAPQNSFSFAGYDAGEWIVEDPEQDIEEIQ